MPSVGGRESAVLTKLGRVLCIALLVIAGSRNAMSQPAVVADKPSRAVIDQIRAQIDERQVEIEKEATLDETTRAGALQRLSEGRTFLEQASADLDTTELIAQERTAASELQAAAEAAAAELPGQLAPGDLAGLSASELEIAADEARAAAQTAQASRVALEEQRSALRVRRPLIGPELASTRAKLAEVRERQLEIRIASETHPGTRSSLPRALAEEQALLARIALLEEQRAGLDVRERLMSTRIELARSTEAAASERARSLLEERDRRQRAELAGTTASAASELLAQDPELRQLADANAELLERYSADRNAQTVAAARAELAAVEDKLADLTAESQYTGRTLATLGRTYAAGQVIVGALRDLPDVAAHLASVRQRAAAIQRVQLEMVGLSRERRRLERELEDRTRAFQPAEESSAEAAASAALSRNLQSSRLDLLERVLRSLEEYAGVLAETQGREQRLIASLQTYEATLRSRQAWVPNLEPIGLQDLRAALPGVAALASPHLWRGSLPAWSAWLRDWPASAALGLIAMIASFALGSRLAAATPAIAGRAPDASIRARVAYGTVPAVVAAAAIAGGVWLTGWLIGAAPEAPVGPTAVSLGLRRIGPGLFLIWLVYLLYSDPGPVVRWRPERARMAAALRQASRRTALVLVLLVTALILFEAHVAGIGVRAEITARLCLILGAAVIAWTIRAAMQPLMAPQTARARPWRRVLYAVGLVLPALLGVAVLGGYVLAALLAARALLGTLALIAIYAALRDIVVDENVTDSSNELLIDRNQLLRLALLVIMAAAFLWVWDVVLQALAYLREVTLWTTESGQGVEAVTVAEVLFFVAVLAGTLLVFWALPILAGTKSLDTSRPGIGTRYAGITLIRYAVLIVGVIAAFSLLNVGWSKLQWLVAGLSVGLGFGMQESVANFIAGLMLLTEGQVRVGDLITVGDKTGIVSRIQVRATTVKDFDGREVILPNKDLVTTEVTNWTLSDSNRRIQIAVGVAYGSDTELVEKLMIDAVETVPWVLRLPAARVVFEQFGDDALKFRLYVWIDSGQRVLDTIHELNRGIDRLFREHGIEIAFPQRDVHLDAAAPLDVRLVPASPQ